MSPIIRDGSCIVLAALCFPLASCKEREAVSAVVQASTAEKAPPAAPEEDEGRYGPEVYSLPAGCAPAGQKYSCDPFTNAGCRAADDEVCDDDDDDAFACFADSDKVKEGGKCNDNDGPSCGVGMTCDTLSESDPRGTCRKFCCSNANCSPPKKCVVLDPNFGTLGVCK
jgi:hypothetical protein